MAYRKWRDRRAGLHFSFKEDRGPGLTAALVSASWCVNDEIFLCINSQVAGNLGKERKPHLIFRFMLPLMISTTLALVP